MQSLYILTDGETYIHWKMVDSHNVYSKTIHREEATEFTFREAMGIMQCAKLYDDMKWIYKYRVVGISEEDVMTKRDVKETYTLRGVIGKLIARRSTCIIEFPGEHENYSITTPLMTELLSDALLDAPIETIYSSYSRGGTLVILMKQELGDFISSVSVENCDGE